MTLTTPHTETRRPVSMVLSPRSLGYAKATLESLLRNSIEPLDLRLITDSHEDCLRLSEALAELHSDSRHHCRVIAEEELNDVEATSFAGLDNLRAFRHGHPCWRKVTDPLLLSAPGEEMILLDPDLYFPNRFRFEATPPAGLLLMWQQPNCLLPPEVVRAAFAAGLRLARHVDIGVSHWRSGGDLAWIDWMIGKLGNPLPRMMHVEAIVWSAIAMREGGGYLDPALWVCWHRTQSKRVERKLGVPGTRILAREPWATMKCFHAGGEAKWWVPDFVEHMPHATAAATASVPGASPVLPFVELTAARYQQEQRLKDGLRKLGYYKLLGARQG